MVYFSGCKGIISFFVYSCVLSLFRGEAKDCNHVKTEFESLTGAVKIVPESPVYVSDLSICFNPLHEETKSCCSSSMEGHYMTAANKFISGQIKSSNAKLKTLVVDNMQKYQDAVFSILQIAENNTALLLTDIFSIPWLRHHGVLSDLFLDLKQFIKRHPASIKASMDQFFDKLFPLVFQYSLSDPTGVTIDEKYRECLEDKRRYFTPMPFADVPTRLSRLSNKVLSLSKYYIEALAVIVEAINTIDKISIELDCKKALTRLQYCSQCRGLVGVLPCKGFCLNVMRGCLAKVAEISPEWDDVMLSIDGLARNIKGLNGVEKLITEFDSMISEALMHSLEIGPKLYERALYECGQLNISTTNSSEKNFNIPGKRVSTTNHGLGLDLNEHVSSLAKQLVASTGIYSRFADDICEQNIYEQKVSTGCWNGTEISSYNRYVPEADFISQAKLNAEVKVSLIAEQTLLSLKDKLSDLRRSIRAKVTDTHTEQMQGDEFSVLTYSSGYGSGSRKYPGVDITDDEDAVKYYSGSGSGDKPDIEVGKPTFTETPVKPDNRADENEETIKRPTHENPNGSGSHTDASLIMLLICSIVHLLLRQKHF